MKTIILATLSFGMLTAGVATAADLPRKAPAPIVARAACAQFGGFYVGISGGGGYYSNTWSDRDAWTSELSDDLHRSNVRGDGWGAIAGGGGGYNWQRNCTVFGIEIDYSWTSLKTSTRETDSDLGIDQDTLTVDSKIRGLGTARTRAGVVVDDLLLYVTGGVAFANFRRTASQIDLNTPGTETFSSSRSRIGWVAGVGTEWAWTGNWSIKFETLYAHFIKDEQTFTCAAVITCGVATPEPKRINNQDSVWISRVGLNYRWGAGR